MSAVSLPPAASPSEALEYFSRRLSHEVDCADVAAAQREGDPDFVLLQVFGNPDEFARCHVPGARHLELHLISEEQVSRWEKSTLFVVYDEGLHSIVADKAAARIAALGRRVKIMRGGLAGWSDEGFLYATLP